MTRRKAGARGAAALAPLLLIPCLSRPAPLAAATLCVSRDGGACHTTIQAAVTASAAGDVIQIRPGVYFENVTVPAGKNGLQLIGAGAAATILDPDVPNSGTGIRIEANAVSVTTLGIRNGQQYGIALASGASRARIQGVSVVGVRGPAALFAEPGGMQHRILENEIRAAGTTGIHLSGANANSTIRGNVVEQIDNAIVALGSGLRVDANRIAGANSVGLRVEGALAVVADNAIERVSQRGLVVVGTNPTVRRNVLTNAGPAAVTCTACTGGLVVENTCIGSRGFFGLIEGEGLVVSADAPGLVVRSNLVSRTDAAAFVIDGTGVRLERNSAIDTGTRPAGNCYRLQGAGAHILADSVATRCGGSGIVIQAPNVRLERNVVTGVAVNGIVVDTSAGAFGAVLIGNEAVDSNAAGFALFSGGGGALLTANRARGNRYDVCEPPFGLPPPGNDFTTSATVCDLRR